ncbi:Translocation and assembly module subunit TamA [Candidatus Erwinia haradaeae]|uniref:Translocation and assembly module subunit TamA n=1 Tax=Candidatus Erwinia haradaeae TaxID=1922217 RepID=A0A451CZ17_9GAMM|nr:autotransporter assembly complex family protein [Candidatus Erwinia haradaeae]VFP78598.1 Translocation and assembly module subunit TamA [Candidatus Erwinia haradaeae]
MLKTYVYYLSFLLINIYSASIHAKSINIHVLGLSGALKKNVEEHLSIIRIQEVTISNRFYDRVEKIVKEATKVFGYYEPKIQIYLNPTKQKIKEPVLIIQVALGEPVIVSGLRVKLQGDAQEDRDYLNLIADRLPKLGSTLNHREYEKFKKSLNNLALEKGYFNANYYRNQLKVSVQKHQAFWDIGYNSGKRYHFSKITFTGSQLLKQYLQNLVPFKEGTYYTSHHMEDLSRRLSDTGWFHSVILIPTLDEPNRGAFLRLHGVLTERTENTFTTGIGSSKKIGMHIRTMWNKNIINNRGHSFKTIANISSPECELKFTYKIPILENPLEKYYLLQGSLKRIHWNDIKTDSSVITTSRYWNGTNGWKKSINLRWRLERFTEDGITNTAMLIYPSISVDRTRSYGGLMPTHGYSQHYSIDFSDISWGSDIDFLVFKIQNSWIKTIKKRNRLIIHTNFGWMKTHHFEKIPPDMRFFAGGNHSIRGYKYKELSPRDHNGKILGASKIIIGSLEHQYNINGKWWGAVFIDMGEVVQEFKEKNIKISIGFGIHWNSPLGPIKLDIARPVNDRNHHRIQSYVGLGPEL